MNSLLVDTKPIVITPQVDSEWVLALPLATVDDAIRSCGLEGHLVALVLSRSHMDINNPASESRWATQVRDLLLSNPVPSGCSLRTQDVSTIGIRIALGGGSQWLGDYPALATRELAREPLPPAVRIHEDERLLLGLAAGVGAAAPAVAQTLIKMLQLREHLTTYRGMCLDLWAESLALGSTRLTSVLADRAMRIFREPAGQRLPVTDDDRIALFWLATRLLEAAWQPTNEDLIALESVIAEGRRAALMNAGARVLTPFDAAMYIDAMTWSPPASLARRTALEYVLGIIDTFPTCADILAKRARGHTPFVISDEYDVQDLFHALARPAVPDLIPEDTTPKLAGKWSRLDFTSKAARLGIEVKHVKSVSHAATVREELLVDEATYHEHPYIDTVVAFVSDPHQHIPTASRLTFERDLSQAVTVNGRTVQYVVRVRG